MFVYKLYSIVLFLFLINSADNSFIFKKGNKTCTITIEKDSVYYVSQSKHLPFITYNISQSSLKEIKIKHFCNEALHTHNGYYGISKNTKWSFIFNDTDSALNLIEKVWKGLDCQPSEISEHVFGFYKPGAFIGQKGNIVDFYSVNTCKSYSYFKELKKEFLKMDYDNKIIVSCGIKAVKYFK